MKSKILLPVVFLCLIITSCNWQIPEKITVKAEPVYKFTAGTIEPQLGDDLNFKSIIKDMMDSGDDTFALYDYNPNGEAIDQQFLIRMPIAEIPIDFNSFLENSGLNSAIRDLSFEETIKIPEINMNVEEKVSEEDLKKSINAALSYYDNHFVSDFKLAEYESGVMKFISTSEVNGYIVEIISNGQIKTAWFNGDTALVDLSNFTIYKDDFTVTINGVSDIPFYALIEESSNIKKVVGLTVAETVPIPCEFVFSASDKNSEQVFEDCVIEEGSLNTEVIVPESWTGISVTYNFVTTGSLDVQSQGEPIDLAGKSIKSGNTTANANIKAKITNATVDFTDTLKIKITSDIRKLESVALSLPDFASGIEISEPFGDEMIDSIKEIDLLSSGLSITYTNTLPAGNDIKLIANSSFIGMNNNEGTLVSGSEQIGKQASVMSDIPEDNPKVVILTKEPVNENEYCNYDFKVDIVLPGKTTENPNRIYLTHVSIGDEYSLSMQIEPVINWKKVVLSDKLADSLSQKNTMELPLDLTGLFNSMSDALGGGSDFNKNIRFTSMPLYVFCTRPEVNEGKENPFANAKFTGNITIYYGKKTEEGVIDGEKLDMESSNAESDEICFCPDPGMEFDTEDKSILITDYSKSVFSSKCDLAQLLNSSLEKSGESTDYGLLVDYDLGFSNGENVDGIEITNDMLTSGGTIGVYAIAIIPLQFKANDTLALDITNLAGDAFSKDLFNRSSAEEMSEINQFTQYLRKVAIDYEGTKLPLFGKMNLDFSINYGEKETGEPEGEVQVTSADSTLQKGTIELETTDLSEKLLKFYPAIPQIGLSIDKDEVFGIPREVGLCMKLTLTIETDVEIPVLGGK